MVKTPELYRFFTGDFWVKRRWGGTEELGNYAEWGNTLYQYLANY